MTVPIAPRLDFLRLPATPSNVGNADWTPRKLNTCDELLHTSLPLTLRSPSTRPAVLRKRRIIERRRLLVEWRWTWWEKEIKRLPWFDLGRNENNKCGVHADWMREESPLGGGRGETQRTEEAEEQKAAWARADRAPWKREREGARVSGAC